MSADHEHQKGRGHDAAEEDEHSQKHSEEPSSGTLPCRNALYDLYFVVGTSVVLQLILE